MTDHEFSLFAMALKTYYPRESLFPNNQAMELWYRELCDIPYETAELALRKWVATNKWSPTISDIRSTARIVSCGDDPDWGEGWRQVIYAIHRYGMYRVEEAMESFDELTRQCVSRLGFKNICMSDCIETDRANFRKLYEHLAEKKRNGDVLPMDVVRKIQSIRKENGIEDKCSVIGIADGRKCQKTAVTDEQIYAVMRIVDKEKNDSQQETLTESQLRERHKQLEDLKKNILHA